VAVFFLLCFPNDGFAFKFTDFFPNDVFSQAMGYEPLLQFRGVHRPGGLAKVFAPGGGLRGMAVIGCAGVFALAVHRTGRRCFGGACFGPGWLCFGQSAVV